MRAARTQRCTGQTQVFHLAVLFLLGGGASELVVVRDVWLQRELDGPDHAFMPPVATGNPARGYEESGLLRGIRGSNLGPSEHTYHVIKLLHH